ncbi:hypothetical protein WN943_019671 [Citrus x changshan-huyou]
MNEISSSNSGENSGTSKNIKESDEEKTGGGNLLSRCRVASFSDVVSSFSSDQQVAVNETGLGSLLDLKCGCLRQELCAALIQQCDVGRQSIILHGKEYNLSPIVFATIMGVRDGGTRVDLNDQAVDITDLLVVYSSGPRGIHIAELFYFSSVVYDRPSIDRTMCPISVWNNDEIRRFLKWQKKLGDIKSNKVSMREPDRLHKPEQAEPPGWTNANNDAFQLLMESQNRTSLDGKTMSKTEEKMILVSDDDTVDRRVKASLRAFDIMLGCIGTTAYTSETPLNSFQFDRGHDLHLTPIPREEGENLAEPLDTKQDFQTSTSMSVPATRPARNRRPRRYQLSPYDKVSQGAKANEIVVSTDDQFISGHNFMSLLPNTAMSGEILTMIAYHFTLYERAKRSDAPINWYLPTIYAQSALTVGADIDGFAQVASVGKPFMLDFQRCQEIYVPINDGTFRWFLFIVNVKEGYGEVWDPLPDGRSNRKREQQAERIHDSQDVRGRLAVQLIDLTFNEARAELLA